MKPTEPTKPSSPELGPGLGAVLVALSDPNTPARMRNHAYVRLRAELAFLAPWLRKKWPTLDELSREDVVQHVVDQAEAAPSVFRAKYDDRSAISWVKKVARHRAIDLIRRADVRARSAFELQARITAASLAAEEQRERRRIVLQMRRLVHAHLEQNSNEFIRESVRMVYELIDHDRTGWEQLDAPRYKLDGASKEDLVRLNALAAKHRQRARVHIGHALHAITESTPDLVGDARVFAVLHRVHWPRGDS